MGSLAPIEALGTIAESVSGQPCRLSQAELLTTVVSLLLEARPGKCAVLETTESWPMHDALEVRGDDFAAG